MSKMVNLTTPRALWDRTIRGHVHMMSAVGGGEGGTPKADVVREVA